MPTLYHDLTCCWSRAVRLAMSEKQRVLTLAPLTDDLRQSGISTPHFIDDDGVQVAMGRLVAEYVNDAFPEPNMIGETPAARAETRRLQELFADPFWEAVGAPLYLEKVLKPRARRSGESFDPFDTRAIRAANQAMVQYAEYIGSLYDQRQWLSYENFSFADAMAVGQISTLDMMGMIPWAELSARVPSFRNWYARAKSRPAFRAVAEDRLPDISPPPHYANPDF